ncbi:MAG: hypothetical protein WC689_01580, partial [Methylocystis sp.]
NARISDRRKANFFRGIIVNPNYFRPLTVIAFKSRAYRGKRSVVHVCCGFSSGVLPPNAHAHPADRARVRSRC